MVQSRSLEGVRRGLTAPLATSLRNRFAALAGEIELLTIR